MAHGIAPFAHQLKKSDLTPPEINALLFYRLGQFVVWGHKHTELAAQDPDFSALLETATWALSRGGIPEPDGWHPPDETAINPVEDSQKVGFDGEDSTLK
jgi:hypothetical protein